MTVQPDCPALASLEALLVIMAKRRFVSGQTGALMGEGNCSHFTPAQMAERGAGREEKEGFSLWSPLGEPGLNPEPAQQSRGIRVLPALQFHTGVQQRRPDKGVGQPEPPQSVFF